MNQKFTRLVLLITVIVLSTYIGGIIIIGTFAPPIGIDVAAISNLDDVDAISDSCCGHFVDYEPPVITLISPADGSSILAGTPILLTIEDDSLEADVPLANRLYNWDNQANKSLKYPYYLNDIPEEIASHVLYVYVLDAAGHWGSAEFTFTVIADVTAPEIELLLPANGSTTYIETTIILNITDDDPKAGLKPKEVLYNWNNATTNETLDFPYELALPDEIATHILHVYAVDNAGNWASENFSFITTLDPRSTPTITIPTTTTTTASTSTQPSAGFELTAVLFTLGIIATVMHIRKRKKS